MSLCFDTGPSRAWLPLSGFERLASDLYRATVPHAATRQRLRDAFARLADDDQARIASRAVGSIGGGTLAAAPARDDALRRELMLLTLREILLLAGADREEAAQLDPRVRAALEEMSRDVSARHTLASLGAGTGLSRWRFGHLFGSELGMSPIHALRVMRLRQAALALQYTGDPVERIAEATGFTSLSHLSREFRRHYGMSPRGYRASHGARSL
jgi:AraC-like DNA-binding protein